MTLWCDIDRKTWTLRLHTKLVSWYLWLHSNKEGVSSRKTEFTNFLYHAICALNNLLLPELWAISGDHRKAGDVLKQGSLWEGYIMS